jgi:hypothetical protein
VHTPRLDDDATAKWPLFVPLVVSSGIGSVFSYPLMLSGAKIGVMTLYDTAEGELTLAQHDDSVHVAEVITETLLALQETAPDGTLAPAFEEAVAYRAQIYQAAGMTSIRLGTSASDALLRIRAYAFAHDQPIAETAALIVSRRLRLPDDHRGMTR